MKFQARDRGGHLFFPNGTNFKDKLPKVMPYHLVKFPIGLSVFELDSGNQNVDGQTDKWMDIGYTILIGRLVTCNPPQNLELRYHK